MQGGSAWSASAVCAAMRPAGNCTSPICTNPRKNVPVVSTTEAQEISAPLAVITPVTMPPFKIRSSALASRISRLEILRSDGLHCCAVKRADGLRAGPAHRRPLAPVEQTKLDSGAICDFAHQSVEGIDLAHQMALANPADGRIAGHLAQGGEFVGEEQRLGAGARRCGRRFIISRHGRRQSR